MVRKIEDTCQLELCCFDLKSVALAQEAGVPAIELCTDYRMDGLWPGVEHIRKARSLFDGYLNVMIRPRSGSFIYTHDEILLCMDQIDEARYAGASGITFGCLTENGEIHWAHLEQIRIHAGPGMHVTFHRAFDQVNSPQAQLEHLIALDISRILTSGGRGHARDHMDTLGNMAGLAGNRLSIVAAGGVRPGDVSAFRSRGIRHVHSSASRRQDGQADRDLILELMQQCRLSDRSPFERPFPGISGQS